MNLVYGHRGTVVFQLKGVPQSWEGDETYKERGGYSEVSGDDFVCACGVLCLLCVRVCLRRKREEGRMCASMGSYNRVSKF